MRKSPDIAERVCENCGKNYKPTARSQKYCSSCREEKSKEYKRKYYKKMFPNAYKERLPTPPCCICGDKTSVTVDGKPYCNKHYQSVHKYGHPFGSQRKRTCQFILDGKTLKILTAKGDVILADSSDYDVLSHHSWCVSKTGYAVARIKGKVVKMHRFLVSECDENHEIDHMNRNRLDNRRENLRICTRGENAKNLGPKIGNKLRQVGIRKNENGRYVVRITSDRMYHHIGNFTSLEEAVDARIKAEKKYHGHFGSHESASKEVVE